MSSEQKRAAKRAKRAQKSKGKKTDPVVRGKEIAKGMDKTTRFYSTYDGDSK